MMSLKLMQSVAVQVIKKMVIRLVDGEYLHKLKSNMLLVYQQRGLFLFYLELRGKIKIPSIGVPMEQWM